MRVCVPVCTPCISIYLLVCACCCSLCGGTCAKLFLGLKELLTDVSICESTPGRYYTLVNNLYRVGRLFLSLQILNLMMQAQAEQQRGRLISGLRPLIILQTELRQFVCAPACFMV